MNKIKAVLFDLDGTLIDSMPAHFESWDFAFKEHGLSIDYKELCLSEGGDCHEIVTGIFKSRNMPVDQQTIKAISDAKTNYYVQNAKPRLFSHVDDMLKLLQTKKVLLALVTGGSLTHLRHTLNDTILSQFQVVVKAGDTKNGKPHPGPYTEALRQLKTEPKNAIAVENAPYGIRAAKAAGIMCVAVSTTLGPDYLSEADMVFKDHQELLTFLRKCFLK